MVLGVAFGGVRRADQHAHGLLRDALRGERAVARRQLPREAAAAVERKVSRLVVDWVRHGDSNDSVGRTHLFAGAPTSCADRRSGRIAKARIKKTWHRTAAKSSM